MAMALWANGDKEFDDDFLLALKLSEGVDQFGLGNCNGQNLDEDYILALKLSEQPDQSGLEDNSDDFLLALKLSEQSDFSGGDDFQLALKLSGGSDQDYGQLETDVAFARRLERELNGGGSTEELEDESPTASRDTSAMVAVLREWYAGLQGQAPKLDALFQHLNSLDNEMLRERSGLRLAAETPNQAPRRATATYLRSLGTGFGNGTFPPSSGLVQIQANKTHDPNVDRKTSAAFDFISANLNDFAGEIGIGQGRRVPVLSIMSAMLDLSLFSETVEMLLRYDSIKELADRLDLVKSLLGLLKAMSVRDEHRSILNRPRRLKRRTKGLQGIAESPPETALVSVIILEDENEPRSWPLFDLLGRLKVQAEVYLKGARGSNDVAFRSGEGATSVSLCEYLVEMHDSMLSTMGSVSSTKSSGKGIGARLGWSESSTAIAPQPESLSEIPKVLDWSAAVLHTHYFKGDAEKIVKPLPGRQPKLVRQIAELTNLPEGIFVRVMDVRPDVLKALIVGPKDTPYEGGLFEFDVLAPIDFPNSPPKVVLRTTGGGRVRFNPNLYADGKVCLSLINTWEGIASEKWVPGSSTLLQVFISIQSMIFVECPYINEPGRERYAGNLESEQHKEFVRANTIRWAMIDWLQDDFKRNGIWKDVIKAHFLRNASQLQQLIRNSAATNVGIWYFNGNLTEDTLVRTSSGGMNLEKELDRCLLLVK